METINQKDLSTKDHWEKVYEDVKSHYGLYLYQQQLVELIRVWSKDLRGKKVLEVGCGKGNEIVELVRDGASCTGLDFSESALQLLQYRLAKESVTMTLVRADARHLPFASNSFDVAFSQGVLEHFLNPSLLLKEQHRVLQENGLLVVEVPNKWTLYTVYKKILMAMNQWAPGWETQYSPQELKSIVQREGFQVIDCVGWDFFILKVFRKLKRKLGLKDTMESSFAKFVRQRLQRNPLLINFFASITLVATKNP